MLILNLLLTKKKSVVQNVAWHCFAGTSNKWCFYRCANYPWAPTHPHTITDTGLKLCAGIEEGLFPF